VTSNIKTMPQSVTTKTTDSNWSSLYKVSGVCALIAGVLFLSDLVVLLSVGAMPSSAQAWLTLFQENKVVGLLQLFFSDLIGLALTVPMIFAFYVILRQINETYSVLATVLGFIGIALVFATNSNYSLLYLSDQYGSATTEIQRSQLVAAAEAVLATGMSGTGLLVAGLFVEAAFVMFSVLMLQGSFFNKGVVYLGILGHGLDVVRTLVLLIFIPIFSTATATAIAVPLLAIGGTLQVIWYPLIARRLLQMGAGESSQQSR
jgi:hypothetical protein